MEGQSWISRRKEKRKKKGCRLCIGGQATTRAAKGEKEGQDKLNDTVE